MTIRTAVSRRLASGRVAAPSLLAITALLIAVAVGPTALGHAEAGSDEAAGDVVGQALVGQFDRTTEKLVQLAEGIPEDLYAWRPSDDVRSVSEALMHTAQANFHLAAVLGVDAPGDLPESLEAVTEKRKVVAALETSIDNAREALELTAGGDMGEMVEAFGQEMTRATVAMIILSHNGEHLGQLIAYGRSNGVVPPWSRARTAPGEGDDEGDDNRESR